MTSEIPKELYYIIGVMIFTNLGLVFTGLTTIFKIGRFVEATKLGIKDAKDCGVRAHVRIDSLEAQRQVKS
jgi:hypothetical protein